MAQTEIHEWSWEDPTPGQWDWAVDLARRVLVFGPPLGFPSGALEARF
jgi:hypothetical protein